MLWAFFDFYHVARELTVLEFSVNNIVPTKHYPKTIALFIDTVFYSLLAYKIADFKV